jgi:catechol 2,3-dioxygenase-like lactoylglutathione lyase family enzyme
MATEPQVSTPTTFIAATPVLASLDIERSAEFFASRLGFRRVHAVQGEYGIVSNGPVQIHFWACTDRHIAEATSCRVHVEGIEALYARCLSHSIVHPNAPLQNKPWGTKEFAVLDPDGNLVAFYAHIDG